MASAKFDLEALRERDLDDTLATFTDAKLEVLIEDAIDLVHSTCPTVPNRLESGTLLPGVYKRRLADIVLRVTRNTGGFQSESEGGASYTMMPVVASGNLWLTQADIDALNGAIPRGASVGGTVSMGVDYGWGRS